MTVVLSAPSSLASVGVGTPYASLASRKKCFVLIREQINGEDEEDDNDENSENGNSNKEKSAGSGLAFHFTVSVDRGSDDLTLLKSETADPISLSEKINKQVIDGELIEEPKPNSVIKGDKTKPRRSSAARRMSTSFRHILVNMNTITELVLKWRGSGYLEQTGGDRSGPFARRNSQFFDGAVVDAEMKAWFQTGVPPSRGSILRFIMWRIELNDDPEAGTNAVEETGGLKLYGGVSSKALRKSSFDPNVSIRAFHNSISKLAEIEDLDNKKKKKKAVRRGSTAMSFTPGFGGDDDSAMNHVPFSPRKDKRQIDENDSGSEDEVARNCRPFTISHDQIP